MDITYKDGVINTSRGALNIWSAQQGQAARRNPNNALICPRKNGDLVKDASCLTRAVTRDVSNVRHVFLKFTSTSSITNTVLLPVDIMKSFCTNKAGIKHCISYYDPFSIYPVSSNTYEEFRVSLVNSQAWDVFKRNTSKEWKANLELCLTDNTEGTCIGTWTAAITINVKEPPAAEIYFPTLTSVAPTVQLNTPGITTPNVAATTAVDMCLYDGKDSTTPLTLTFSDEEKKDVKDRAAGLFSLYHHDDNKKEGALQKTDAAHRIDYSISVLNPVTKKVEKVENNKVFSWKSTDKKYLREYTLPNKSKITCVPAPLTFSTQFNVHHKEAGEYEGKLKVVYTPGTSA